MELRRLLKFKNYQKFVFCRRYYIILFYTSKHLRNFTRSLLRPIGENAKVKVAPSENHILDYYDNSFQILGPEGIQVYNN